MGLHPGATLRIQTVHGLLSVLIRQGFVGLTSQLVWYGHSIDSVHVGLSRVPIRNFRGEIAISLAR